MEEEKIDFVNPALKYKDSYIEALHEFAEIDGDSHIDINEREKNFDIYLQKVETDKALNTKHLVPNFQYWLVRGDRYLGRVNYRPQLDEKLKFKGGNIGYAVRPSERGKGYASLLLKKTLELAKKDGLQEVLLTTDTDNTPSIKVIEKAGGKFTNDAIDEKGVKINRYIISL